MRGRKKWGGDNNKCEKCEKRGERIEETLEQVLTECSEYGEERDRLDERIGNKLGQLWDIRKREEDKGLKTMLGLKDRSQDVVKYTKEFLKAIWRKKTELSLSLSLSLFLLFLLPLANNVELFARICLFFFLV